MPSIAYSGPAGPRTTAFPLPGAGFLRVSILCGLLVCAAPGRAQLEPAREVAATLAEGRVVISPAKDGIVIATIGAASGTASEPGSYAPAIVPLGALRAAIVLGAVEFGNPGSGVKPARLDSELAGLGASAFNTSARQNYDNAASDIETIGVAVLERIRQLAGQFHQKVNLAEGEPLIRVILAGEVPDYGADVWVLDYHIRQDALGNDYWRTRVLRPRYTQLYPPEKGEPRVIVEVEYPPAAGRARTPELMELLRRNDARLAAIRASSEAVSKSIALVAAGESQKSSAAANSEFMRAAIPAITSQDANLSMAVIYLDSGLQWLLEPAPEQRPPADDTPREPEAPTLRRKRVN